MPTNIIGRQISRLRSSAGLSQEQLSAKCQTIGLDISRGTLAKIESRVRCVTDDEVLLFAKALGVGVAELYPKGKSK